MIPTINYRTEKVARFVTEDIEVHVPDTITVELTPEQVFGLLAHLGTSSPAERRSAAAGSWRWGVASDNGAHAATPLSALYMSLESVGDQLAAAEQAAQ